MIRTVLFLLFSATMLVAQAPDPSTPICTIPAAEDHRDDFEDTGLPAGVAAPDFTLYDRDGNPFVLSDELAEGRPVAIINGSYTCPVFRGKLGAINRLQASYGNDVRIIIVYTLEAHPITDISTYFGFVNPGRKNQDEGILYRQPTTYGERLAIVDDMLAAMSFEVPVYVDGPCNDWWEIYGYAPNNAYLIDTDGTITAKHGWFNRSPHDMESDIRELLGDEPIDGGDSGVGSFSFTMDSERIVRGNPDDVIYSYGMLKNTGDVPVTIDILRRVMRMPEGWETSLCTDICLSPHVDSTSLELAPGAEQSFTLYVYTNADATPSDTARVSILFRNAADPQQSVRQSFGAVIAPTSSVATEPNGYGRFLDLE